jgi:hypothetical protein
VLLIMSNLYKNKTKITYNIESHKYMLEDHICEICNIKGDHFTKNCIFKCNICNGNHKTHLHKCSICEIIGANHRTYYCPYRCKCNGYHTQEQHRCLYCGVRNPDHKDEDCSFRFNVRRR